MSIREKPNQRLVSLFHEQSCWMIEPLAAEMKYSIPSVRRFLAEVGYFSSFTHNGSWYTLHSIPRFDGDGLWFFRDIGFSRSGSLTSTLIDLAARSPAGMTAETLGAKLRVRCHSVLVQLCRNGRLQRQKMARSHVYFSVDPSIATVQRRAMAVGNLPLQLPAEIAVLILVEFIQNPDSSFEDLTRAISRKTRVAINVGTDPTAFRSARSKKNDSSSGAAAWRALKSCLARLSLETSPASLFPRPPVIRFFPKQEVCGCGRKLVVQKTRRKSVLSMNGPFIAHETVYECRTCSRVFGSEELLRLAPSRCNVAYDILVFVGEALFRRHQTTQEVRAELIARNVRLSNSEIAYLGRKFITFLAAGHHRATPRIRQAMKLSGGYVLHLDATHEGDAPALMTGMDSLSKIVLANVKLPSEHADHIVPFLRKVQADYGTPRACVHDMGTGICKAVAEVFPGTRDLICHFHFLRDIGKDFLDPAYDELRKRLRSHAMTSRLHALVRNMRSRICGYGEDAPALMAEAIKTAAAFENTGLMPLASAYSLALWALQGKHCGDGYGFPFDRPLLVFAERVIELSAFLSDLIHLLPADDRQDNQPLFNLARIASRARKDIGLRQAVEELRWRSQTFDLLRQGHAHRVA